MAEQPLTLTQRLEQRMQELGSPDSLPGKVAEPSGGSLTERLEKRTQETLGDRFSDPRVLKPSGAPEDISVGQMASEAYKNLPRSAYEAGAAMISPIIHPIETAKNIGALGKGAYSKALGYLGVEQDPRQKAKDEAMANALGEFYANRYGSIAGFKQAVAKDPFGVLLDVSAPFTLGETALARAPGVLGTVGKAAGTVAKFTDPMRAAPAAVGAVARAPGVKPVVEAVKEYPSQFFESRAKLPSGTLETAYEAGRRPSADLQPFVEQMRGTAPKTEIVDLVNTALENQNKLAKESFMKDRNAALALKEPVNYNMIDKAFADADASVRNRAGDVMFGTAGEALNEIKNKIDSHKQGGLMLLQDMDDLKRSIDDVYSKYGGNKDARRVITEIRNAVKGTIGAKSQKYLDLMEQETARRDLLKEFNFAVGSPDAVPQKQLAKILSNMKKEDRAAIINQIASYDPRIASAIKGASVSDLGRIGGVDFLLYALGSGLGSHPVGLSLAGAHYLSESPRALGEAAYKAGQAAKFGAEKVAPVVELGKPLSPFIQELGKYEERKQREKQKEKFMEPLQGSVPVRADGGRVARADGGRIDVVRGVRALMRAAENAKKNISKNTETLLEQPDEHIAQALDMAKKHI